MPSYGCSFFPTCTQLPPSGFFEYRSQNWFIGVGPNGVIILDSTYAKIVHVFKWDEMHWRSAPDQFTILVTRRERDKEFAFITPQAAIVANLCRKLKYSWAKESGALAPKASQSPVSPSGKISAVSKVPNARKIQFQNKASLRTMFKSFDKMRKSLDKLTTSKGSEEVMNVNAIMITLDEIKSYLPDQDLPDNYVAPARGIIGKKASKVLEDSTEGKNSSGNLKLPSESMERKGSNRKNNKKAETQDDIAANGNSIHLLENGVQKSQLKISKDDEPSPRMSVKFEGEGVVRVKSKRNALPPPSRNNGPSKLSTSITDNEPSNEVENSKRTSMIAGKSMQNMEMPVQRQSVASSGENSQAKSQSTIAMDSTGAPSKKSKGPTKQLQNLREYASSNEELDMIKQLEASLMIPDVVVTETEPEPERKQRRRQSAIQVNETIPEERRRSISSNADNAPAVRTSMMPPKQPKNASQIIESKNSSTESLPRTLLKSLKSNIAAKSRSSMVPNPKIKDQRMAESVDFGNGFANPTEVVVIDKRKK